MKKRLCTHCGYKWPSETFYREGDTVPCPKCEKDVPGDSIAKEG